MKIKPNRRRLKIITVRVDFRLSRPMETGLAIEANLVETKKSEAFIASLLLTSARAVGSPLSTEYEKLLKEISVDDR